MKRRMPLMLVLTIIALAAVALAPAASPVSPRKVVPPGKAAPTINHFVVMTQGARSFDNYFGTYAGVDGIPVNTCQLPSKVSQGRCVRPAPITSAEQQRPLLTNAAVQSASVNGGRMNGFVKAQTSASSDGTAAVRYYRPQSLPLLSQFANRGVLFDHWFSGVPGGTIGNRLFDITARPPGDPTSVPSTGWPDSPVIFDRLNAAGVSWRIYVQHYEPALTIDTASTKERLGGQIARVPVLAMPRYTQNPALSSHVVDLSEYYKDLANRRLPAVSYIVSTSATEQSPQDPEVGQRLVRAVLNGLLASSAWKDSAFLLQYDSSGGWYDHVRPPRIAGATIGLRVPVILISPYAKPNTVDHSRFEAASVLKFIEHRWALAPLATRDQDAPDFAADMTNRGSGATVALVSVSHDQRVVQPDRTMVYLGYGAVIALAVLIGLAALVLGVSDRRQSTRHRWFLA